MPVICERPVKEMAKIHEAINDISVERFLILNEYGVETKCEHFVPVV